MLSISTDTSDMELIEEIRNGNSDALNILYERYSSLVYSVALKILTQPSEAEELTQEVFINLWTEKKFNPNRAALSTYLCIVARSRSISRIRSKNTHLRTLEKLKINPPMFPPTPLEKASCLEKQETLRQALKELPQKYHQILEMNYYQGLSHTQISQALEMPLGTVKTYTRKGILLLRQILGIHVL